MNINIADSIDALVMLFGGTMATIIGYRKIDDKWGGTKKISAKALRWLGPLIIVSGIINFSRNLDQNKFTAESVAMSIRSSMHPPAQVDEITTLDSVESIQNRVVFLMTISNESIDEIATKDFSAMRPNIIRNVCENSSYVKILKSGIVFEFIYAINDEVKSPIVITKVDCSKS